MIQLGDKVKDPISNLVGIATGRTDYLYGCIHILVQPAELKDGKPVEGTWFDEARLEVVERGAVKPPAHKVAANPGGPMLGPTPPHP